MIRRLRSDEGAAAVVICAAIVVLLGATALAVDVGAVYAGQRQMQNAADAAALAAAAEIVPGVTGDPEGVAANYVTANAPGAAVTVQPLGQNRVRVIVASTVQLTFAQVFGRATAPVQGSAIAAVFEPDPAQGRVYPFGVLTSEVDGLRSGDSITFLDWEGRSTGNSGLLALNGGNNWQDPVAVIEGGGRTDIKKNTSFGTATGNAPHVYSIMESKISGTSDSLSSVVSSIDPRTGLCALRSGALSNPRLVMCPIIDSLPTGGSANVMIRGFAYFFVTSVSTTDRSMTGVFLRPGAIPGTIHSSAYSNYGPVQLRLVR